MTHRRQEQLGEQIGHEIAELIRTKVRDPRVGFASITDVELSNDLRHARVFVSVLGTKEEINATLHALDHAAGFLRHELSERLEAKYIPELLFRTDDSIAKGARINELLQKAHGEVGSDN